MEDPIGSPLEDHPDGAEKEAELNGKLQEQIEGLPKRALILMTSHIGGHKYAGNVIVRAMLLLSWSGADTLYRFTCPRVPAYGMVVYRRTKSSQSCIRLSSVEGYYPLYCAGASTLPGQTVRG